MKKFFLDNWIILVIGISFLTSTVLALRNNYIIERNHLLQQQTDLVKQRTQEILSKTMHGLDLGVRGFGLTSDDQLLIPYHEAVATTPATFRQLDSLLTIQGYEGAVKLEEVEAQANQYIKFSNDMITMARNGEMDAFTGMLKEDRGYQVWAKYSEFSKPLFEFEDELNKQSLAEYQYAIQSNLILQVAILILAFPMLYIFVTQVKKERSARQELLHEVEKTDRTFVFNHGQNHVSNENVTHRSIENVKQASEFIGFIASGNYEVEWKGLNQQNIELNSQTLAGNLVHLRERLKSVKQEDERRNWVNEGLASFSDIVRNSQHQTEDLTIKCVSFLTRYVGAQQGSLFIVEGEDDDRHLKLAACYAFERKKWIEKRIEIGDGLVGQAYLEGQPIRLKEVPKGYTHITSGLGDSTPAFIAIVPMQYERQTLAVAEFATFKDLDEYKVTFLQKAGEFLASAIVATRTTAKMKLLLEEAAEREEQMRQREEELRQNMEELQATQEELMRKQKEVQISGVMQSA
jgi:CHASE3 domain sensor protein